ncbi:hypothetical protein PUNSTDRAFT_138800 [Punctularia strigosozonata HHB-11173 SS5]|uniref:Ubiquinol-cytochrome c chaperone domain-containing protein n=1 Tax=Punctularia strigosozonata (strain HHB-11173) TaxID=741275 RepID=R7S113_PUNST|nr:uncharacterized protein PUNSTDRAFT_138800 [Punctularia strigosozonata HHB-11173 SS5]EIN04070.1 hypothetical protein PUNSTDRAFT_138800 [Punctularia strigosozonata HHB-11173 SS5]
MLVKHLLRSSAPARVVRTVRAGRRVTVLKIPARRYATQPPEKPSSPPAVPPAEPTGRAGASPLTPFLRRHPWAMTVFLGFTRLLGYSNPRQVAARRSLALYETLCVPRAEDELEFWRRECDLPPTFQSWFTITNLHVWLLTTRLRALPKSQAEAHIQGLIDHFFLDVEDRIRAVLQPKSFEGDEPEQSAEVPEVVPTSTDSPSSRVPLRASGFYHDPRKLQTENTNGRKRKDAPESLVSRQMKILREQWAGLGMAFDVALIKGDAEMAGAVWRNLLGARGARGIALPTTATGASQEPAPTRTHTQSNSPLNVASTTLTSTPSAKTSDANFRRSINLVGGSTTAVRLVDNAPGGVDAAEMRDDGSGVRDYTPSEADKYVSYPELMATIVAYIRREVHRLEQLSDDDILGQKIMKNDRVAGREVAVVDDRLLFGPLRH